MSNKRLIDMTEEELALLILSIIGEKIRIEPERFIPEEDARKLLNCGKTQLYYLRTNGKISFVQDDEHPKMILYDRDSILKYLETNLKTAF